LLIFSLPEGSWTSQAFLTHKTSESDLSHKIAFVRLEVFFPTPLTLTQSKFCTESYGQNSTQRSVAELICDASGRTDGARALELGARVLVALDPHFGSLSAHFLLQLLLNELFLF
jgi:hypothetical protein